MKLEGPLRHIGNDALEDLQRLTSDIGERSLGRYSTGTLVEAIAMGGMQFWRVRDGETTKAIVLTELLTYRTGLRVCNILVCAGEDMKEWSALIEQLEDWAKANGCRVIEAWARPGWERVLGWRRTHVKLEREL